MKLPSIGYLYENARATLLRFPQMILSALIAVALGIYLIECNESISNIFPFINIILSASIGIPLYFSASILAYKKKWNRLNRNLIALAATVILVILYFTFPDHASTHNRTLPYIKYAIYNLTAHLLVSFIPFINTGQLNAFWQYNKILFLRICTGAIYSFFLFTGLSLALTALHLLFDINIHEKLFLELYISIVGIFNTWFFANGIPTDFDQLEEKSDYPKGLKIFAQYILLPLLALYLLILYVYGGKILLFWDWPKGIVSYLIVCIAVLGILTFLLLYPFGKFAESTWIKKIGTGFYILLLPLLCILFIAILMRIDDYGITINRYIILALGVWLSIVCVYTYWGKPNIKFVPLSLAATLLLTSFGPWGMFAVSEHYQLKRLEKILEQAAILKNGKIVNEANWDFATHMPMLSASQENKNDTLLNDSLHNEVKSIIDYLDQHHGFSKIKPWFRQDIDSIIHAGSKNDNTPFNGIDAQYYMQSMGLNYAYKYSEKEESSHVSFEIQKTDPITNITGFDFLIDWNKYLEEQKEYELCSFTIENKAASLQYKNISKPSIILETSNDTLSIDLHDWIASLRQQYKKSSNENIPASAMTLFGSGRNYEIKLVIHQIEINNSEKAYPTGQMEGQLFIQKKKR